MRDRVNAYANGWYTHASTPEDFAEKAKKVVQKGYRALKFDPFGTSYMVASSEAIKRSISIIKAIRESVGDGVDLLIGVMDVLPPKARFVLQGKWSLFIQDGLRNRFPLKA